MLLRIRSKGLMVVCVGIMLGALCYYQTRLGSRSTGIDDTVWKFHMKFQKGGQGRFNPARHAQHRKLLDYTSSVLDQDMSPEELLKKTLLNEQWKKDLYGTIWPRDEYNETESRIEQQIEFLDLYHRIKNRTGGVKQPKVIFGYGWTNMETFNEGKAGQEIFINDGCPENWCIASRDQKKHELTADAVLFSHTYPRRESRDPKQIWIAQDFKSPFYNKIDAPFMKNLVNWSISYRRDSAVVLNYGFYRKNKSIDTSKTLPLVNYAEGKTKIVAMLVSNCDAKNDRLEFAKELREIVHVDIYGKCGHSHYKCGVEGTGADCVKWMSKSYKFFLAFENSNCKDYISEIFLINALTNDIVPIVYGAKREDYEAVAPPNSFIYANDFPSVSALADYLVMLDKNDELYNEYFRWKGNYYFLDPLKHQRHWCRVCTLLHLQSDVDYVHNYDDYSQWWQGPCNKGSRPPFILNRTIT